jgi:GNAT superfamily N-acetyltransferase
MERTDAEALLAFFKRIPEEDRFFLKDDVTSAEVIGRWAEDLNYDRALPLLAFRDDQLIANAVLIRHRGGYQRHLAEIRILIDPAFRGRGLGVGMIRQLVEIAWDAELEFAQFEFVRGINDDAIQAAEFLGAMAVGSIPNAAKDPRGDLHDLVFLQIPLGKGWQWSQF